MGAGFSSESSIPQQPNRPAPEPPGTRKKRKAPEPPKDSNVSPTIGSELVEQIRIG